MADLLQFVSGASFKEIPFLVESHTMTGGRKDALHNFVNSDKQKIEDLGLKRRSISLTAVIHGENYFIDRDRLLGAIEEGGSGTLVHPFFGNMENMVARTYSLKETFSKFGVAEFSISFEYSSPETAAPVFELSTVSEVQLDAQFARESLSESMSDGMEVPSFSSELDSVKGKLASFTGVIDDASKASDGIISEINSFNDQLTVFSGSLVALVSAPVELARSVSDLYVTMTSIFDAPKGALSATLGMFGFGDDDPDQLPFKTQTNDKINRNKDVVNTSINTFSLIQAYEFLVQSDFSTLEELEAYERSLEEQYQKVMNTGVITESGTSNTETEALSRSAKSSLTTLRTSVSKVIEETKTTLPNIVKIEVNVDTPLRVLEYQYYGNNNQSGSLRDINENPDESFISGNVGVINNVISSS